MAENNNSSDEIDLGQLFQMIGNGLKKLFVSLLRVFLYLKKNILILSGLVVIGLLGGYGLNQIVSKKLKTEVIVKPNLESKNYLYGVIDEIQANINAKNIDFFKNAGIEISNLDNLKVEISKVDSGADSEGDIKYLELLQSFEKTDAISDIVRAELKNKSSFYHRITFFYKNAGIGEKFARKIIAYINTNDYFDGLIKIHRINAENRIEENKTLLKQVDELIANYAKKMTQNNALTGNERIVLDNQERINITGLFDLKNDVIRDIEAKNLELQERTEPIKVINFGRTQQVQKAFFEKSLVLIPLILLGIFFVLSFIKYLNKKASEI